MRHRHFGLWLVGILLLAPTAAYPALPIWQEDDVIGTWRGTFTEGCRAYLLSVCGVALVKWEIKLGEVLMNTPLANTWVCPLDTFNIDEVRVFQNGNGQDNVTVHGETSETPERYKINGGRIDLGSTTTGAMANATSRIDLLRTSDNTTRTINFRVAGTACSIGGANILGDAAATYDFSEMNTTMNRIAFYWEDSNRLGGVAILDRIGSDGTGPDSLSDGEFLSVRR